MFRSIPEFILFFSMLLFFSILVIFSACRISYVKGYNEGYQSKGYNFKNARTAFPELYKKEEN